MKDFLKTVLLVVGGTLFSICVCAFIAFAFVWILVFLGAAIFVVFATWSIGTHIEVKENEIPVGYFKWFTYYPYKK